MSYYIAISNNLKKFVASLKRKEARDESRLFIAEGEKLCSELVYSNYKTELIVLSSKASDDAKKIAEMFHKKNIPVYIARKQQFEQLCDTKTPQSILAVVHNLDYQLSLNSPIIILESISDPGNFGTIIRTADWFGINHIITGSNSVDKYNPKVIRSTMGSIFRCNIQYIEDLLPFFHKASGDYEIYGASLKAKMTIEECKPKKKFILIFGNEAKGISQDIQSQLHFAYKIIGKGKAESLNLAVSVGISLYHFANCIK